MGRQTSRIFVFSLAALLLVGLVVSPGRAFGQGSVTATLSGTVADSTGAVVAGATISAKNNATASVTTAVSGSDGLFGIPALQPGDYTVTITMQGFKTVTLQDVRLNAGVPATIKPVLMPGGFSEVVEVQGSGEILKTTQTTVAATITQQQITRLPLPGRGAFDMVMFMPGISSADGTARGGMINGLPTSTVNITLDGMNIQDNYAKTWDGMFTRVSPRLDAVEEVTISTAGLTADMAGQGGPQVKFVTRSGTNTYHGSLYYYLRRDWMNSNTWYNLHSGVKNDGTPTGVPTLKNYQPGGSIGGPVRIPKLFNGRDKLFFFVNYEWLSSPGNSNQTKTIMSPLSEQGIFQYAGGPNVDLMALAAKNGQISKIDPTVARLLADVRKSTSGGVVNNTADPLTQSFVWQQPTKSKTTYPTVRIDYNISSKHTLTGSYTRNKLLSDPDTTNNMQVNFPGFPIHGLQDSERYSGQGTWRWTVTNHIVNEFRYGKTGGATLFYPDLTADMFGGTGFGGMNGYAISWSSFKSLSNAYYNSANSSREGKTTVFEDTLSWMKGAHMLSMGVSYTKAAVWLYNQTKVPTVTLGMTTSGDPADPMFTTANFPKASSTDLTNARNLYAVLTGRVSQITRNARIQSDGSTYKILGSSNQYGTLPQWGSFISDSWRWRPNVTINAGLRYDVQRPFYADNNSYAMATLGDLFGVTGVGKDFQPGSVVNHLGNLFKPGTFEGTTTTVKTLSQGTNAYNVDWGDFGPSLGAAWNVGAKTGLLHILLGGEGNSVLRGGANYAFQRGGMSDFTGPFGNNPGIQIDATRNLANGNLGTLPVILSSSDLGPPAANLTRSNPLPIPNVSTSVYAFDPNLKTASVLSYSFSWQRQLAKDTSVEARFVHTNSFNQWTDGQLPYLDLNELNITENGFMNEFKKAMGNLQANIAAGKGNTFAYTGAAGTVPLPIFLAYLNGSTAANSATSYTGSGWTSSTMVQSMYPLNPTPQTAASSIRLNSGYLANGIKAGYPSNFWVANPDVNHAYLITNAPKTTYNGVQISVNRRFARGLLFQANYTYGKAYMDEFYSFHKPYKTTEMNYTNVYSDSPNGNATGNVRHVFVGNWTYELPFGRGKHWGSGVNGFWDRVIGGWGFQGVARLQSGRMLDLGNVNLVGMTPDYLRSVYKLRKVQDPQNQYRTVVYMLPQDIIDNTIKAFSVNASGYTAGAPTGKYIAPANSSGCMESAIVPGGSATAPTYSGRDGFGDCGGRSLVVTGPMVMRSDFNFIKRIKVNERVTLEGQAQIFNVFNNVNFNPNNYVGSVLDSYNPCVSSSSTCAGNAVDQSRTMQLAFRITF